MNAATRETLEILIHELRQGAAGPCDYWYRKLADRLEIQLLPDPNAVLDIQDGPHRILSSGDQQK